MTLRIISAPSALRLEEEAMNYEIDSIGSLTVSNGHFYLAFLGKPKLTITKVEDLPATQTKSTAKRVAAQKGK